MKQMKPIKVRIVINCMDCALMEIGGEELPSSAELQQLVESELRKHLVPIVEHLMVYENLDPNTMLVQAIMGETELVRMQFAPGCSKHETLH